MSVSERAVEIFNSGYNCAQSVLLSFAEKFNLDKDVIIKITSGFGGGMARMQETCGAITGSIMVIGLAAYNVSEDFPTSKERVYYIISKFVARFKKEHGSTICSELLNCNLSTKEGNIFYEETDLRNKKCAKCVKDSVVILEEIIGKYFI